uniref:TRPM-like domain-containing protein n=1 Tax=Panagrolaimus superbus TaxID=310955 RepID=A0A914XWX5_9BILA
MGNAFRCHYTTRAFKSRYDKFKKSKSQNQISRIGSFHLRLSKEKNRNKKKKKDRNFSAATASANEGNEDFKYPFNDLMLWAVLTQRHDLAKCLWNHGEEAMAKALVAIRLYKCMSKEAADDYTEVEVSNQLREYAE